MKTILVVAGDADIGAFLHCTLLPETTYCSCPFYIALPTVVSRSTISRGSSKSTSGSTNLYN